MPIRWNTQLANFSVSDYFLQLTIRQKYYLHAQQTNKKVSEFPHYVTLPGLIYVYNDIANIHRYKQVATINDQCDSMTVTLSDNAAKKLFGTTSDMLIAEDDPDHRKNLPPIINDSKGVMKKMTLRMIKTLNNSNIRFILTEIEQSPTITTPHPHTPTTFDITNKPTTSSSQQQPVKVRKTIMFEEAG